MVTRDDGPVTNGETAPWNVFEWIRNVSNSGLPAATQAVGFTLIRYAYKDGTNAHPGERLLGTKLGLGNRQIRRHLHALRDAGLIALTAGGATAQKRAWANVWKLTHPTTGHTRPQVTDDLRTSGPGPWDIGVPPTTPETPTNSVLAAGRETAFLADDFEITSNLDDLEALEEELGDLLFADPVEMSTITGMLQDGRHPKAIINKIRADRRGD
jgi:hypothetical protein